MFSAFAKMQMLAEMPLATFAKNEEVKKRQEKQLKAENAKLKRALAMQQEVAKREAIIRTNREIRTANAKANKQKFNRFTISINDTDKAFSLAIRLRANCRCENPECGQQYSVDNLKDLHCAHYYSRENENVRYHPLNAIALCKGCHINFDRNNKAKFSTLMREKLTELEYLQLTTAANAPKKTLLAKNKEKMTAWYSLIARQLKTERLNGNTEYINFERYQDDFMETLG